MSNWRRIKPLTRDEARKLAQWERMPKGVLKRDDQIKMERWRERRDKAGVEGSADLSH
jgi:hypothetical protein